MDRKPRWPLLALLMLLPSAAAVGPLDPPQNDAGSGGDAGDLRHEALPIVPGTHEGRLSTLRAASLYIRAPLLDASDWYAVELPAGAEVVLDVALLSGEPVLFELRRPDGGIAAWTVASTPRSVSTVTHVAGTWWVHAMAFNSAGGSYRFTLAHAPLAAPPAVHPGPGWTAIRVDVEGPGPERLRIANVFASSNTGIRRDLYLLRDGEFRFGLVDGVGMVDPLVASAAGIQVETSVRTHGGLWTTFETEFLLSTPGRYHLVVLVQAEDAYTFLRAPVPAAWSRGPDVVALRAADFDAPVAVTATAADAGVLAQTSVTVGERAFLGYLCGDPGVQACTFSPPGGSPSPVSFGMWAADEPGTWRFTRDGAGVASFSGYVLLAADIRLP